MTRKELLEKINEVFQDVFDDEDIIVTEETTPDDIDDWDSLEHINLIAALESEFSVKFSMNEASQMKQVGSILDILISKIQ